MKVIHESNIYEVEDYKLMNSYFKYVASVVGIKDVIKTFSAYLKIQEPNSIYFKLELSEFLENDIIPNNTEIVVLK
jgi:hypothetical protein